MEKDLLNDDMILSKQHFNSHKYYIINKPIGVLSTKNYGDFHEAYNNDIYNLALTRKFPIEGVGAVGRLDKDTSGLIIMTSDGRLNRALTYPCENSICNPYKEKDYILILSSIKLFKFSDFVSLENEMSEPFNFFRKGSVKSASEAKVKILRYWQDEGLSKGYPHLGWCIEVKITIKEGKNHQIRRIASRSKMKVLSLQRTRMACILSLDSVPAPSDCRWLNYDEVKSIYIGLNITYNQEEVCGKKFNLFSN